MKNKEHTSQSRPRIAVVSPFLDKQHGTERCVAEQIERVADDFEIHLYSSVVHDMDLSKIIWHRVPRLPGPHLVTFCWWVFANHLRRWWDGRFRGLKPEIVYSPGINCFDADVISVHVVFGELAFQLKGELRLRRNPASSWPRLLHRRLMYRLLMALERCVYSGKKVALAAVSSKVASEVEQHCGRRTTTHIIHNAVDSRAFNPEERLRRRAAARARLGLADSEFVLLLIGNDGRTKGLGWAMEAVARLPHLSVKLLAVGEGQETPYKRQAHRLALRERIIFQKHSPDVMEFYSAADAYFGPSNHDSFALPPLEAMACGLPVITSARNGGSEIITHGVDGFVLSDPSDVNEAADLIARLYADREMARRAGSNAASTAQKFDWDTNAQKLKGLIDSVICRRVVFGTDEISRAKAQRATLGGTR